MWSFGQFAAHILTHFISTIKYIILVLTTASNLGLSYYSLLLLEWLIYLNLTDYYYYYDYY